MTSAVRTRRPSLRAATPWIATGIVALFLVSGIASSIFGSVGTAPAVAAGSHGGARLLGGGGGGSTFLLSTDVPSVPAASQDCFFGTCVNVTNDPSINLTSQGTLAVAYTAYTNASACPADMPYAQSEIGVVFSYNLGSTWTDPIYLGNPVCGGGLPTAYPSAWEPSLTSLANGTMVLSYVEFSLTSGSVLPDQEFGPTQWNVPTDRLVVTESYDQGASWTVPVVLASSSNPLLDASAAAPLRPSAVAWGDTVYVSWMDLSEGVGFNYSTYPYGQLGNGLSSVQFAVSTDGGQSFAAPLVLPSAAATGNNASLNPTVIVTPNGTVFVAYATDLTFQPSLDCAGVYNCITGWTTDIWVGRSATNGSSFAWGSAANATLSVAAPGAPAGAGPFFEPAPQVAFSESNGQLVLAYGAGGAPILPCGPYGCDRTTIPSQVFITNSSTNGSTWSPAHAVHPELFSAIGYPVFSANETFQPALAIAPNGVVDLAFAFLNQSFCLPPATGEACGQGEMYTTSANDGQTFGPAFTISGNTTNPTGSPYGATAPQGEYATAVAAGGRVWVAWTQPSCPTIWSGVPCYYPSSVGNATVVISSPEVGPFDVNFTETGVPAGLPWSVDVMGNIGTAVSPAPISVTGIPAGENVSFEPWTIQDGWGTRFANGTPSVTPPYTVTGNLSIAIPYTKQYQVDVTTVPNFPVDPYPNNCYGGDPFSWDNPACPTTSYNLTPTPGDHWVDAGSRFALNASPTAFYCGATFGCSETDYANLSFQSWIGTGAGSASQTAPSAEITVSGPINETASFADLGWCEYTYAGAITVCYADSGALLFQEQGLPKGTEWNLTASGSGVTMTLGNDTPWITLNGPIASSWVNFTAWAVPAPGNEVWVPTTDPISPVILPGERIVEVRYALQSTSTQAYSTTFQSQGLPAGSTWSISVDGVDYATNASFLGPISLGAGSHTFAGGPVYAANGTGFVPTAFSTQSLTVNDSGWTNTSGSATNVSTSGPTQVTVVYQPAFEVTADPTTGGTTSFASAWVGLGQRVWLNATNESKFEFVSWTGTGPGSYSGKNPDLHLAPAGPVTEIALFVSAPLPAWTVFVTPSGVPAGGTVTVDLGGQAYAGSGPFQISGIAPGLYNWSAPYGYLNSSELTRYVLSGMSTSFPQSSGQLDITGNGTLSLSFEVQYLVATSVQGGGTVTVRGAPSSAVTPASAPDSAWVVSGTPLWINATPSAGSTFEGFTGTIGAGQVGPATVLAIAAASPLDVVATFLKEVAPLPRVYALSITETGLPTSLSWNASVGSQGVSGRSATLVIGNLNGSYTLVVPVLHVSSTTQYVPAYNPAVGVTANSTAQVTFSPEYLVTIIGSAGGSVGPSTTWANQSQSLVLSATAASGSEFVNWTGTGPGSYSGTTSAPTLTVAGPITEIAAFSPIPTSNSGAPAPSSSSTTGLPIALGLLVALLVVGFLVGYLLLRRPAPAAPDSSEPVEETDGSSPDDGLSPTTDDAASPTMDDVGSPTTEDELPPEK